MTISFSGYCQFLSNTLIKTRPLQDFIGKNPNIGFEFPINNKFSLEFDYMYRNQTWYLTGGEWDFGWFYPSKGFRILGGARGYISKKKEAPFGWFWGTQFVVKHSELKDIGMKGFNGITVYTQDIKIFQIEIIPLIGYQFLYLKRISFEFYTGLAIWPYRSEKTEITDSMNPEIIGDKGYTINNFHTMIAPEFTISLGVILNKN